MMLLCLRQGVQDFSEHIPQVAGWDLETGHMRESEELCPEVLGHVKSGAPLAEVAPSGVLSFLHFAGLWDNPVSADTSLFAV